MHIAPSFLPGRAEPAREADALGYGARNTGNQPVSSPSGGQQSSHPQSAAHVRPTGYQAVKEDLLDAHVGYYLRHHPTVYAKHSILRIRAGVYELDGREIDVEWQYATEPDEHGFLVAVDGPLRQPFADYMEMTEANVEYDSQSIGGKSALQSIPKAKRMSFNDQHKMYSRLEAMKVAKEQALVREKAADYVKDGQDIPQDLMHKYKKTIQSRLGGAGVRRAMAQSRQGAPDPAGPPPHDAVAASASVPCGSPPQGPHDVGTSEQGASIVASAGGAPSMAPPGAHPPQQRSDPPRAYAGEEQLANGFHGGTGPPPGPPGGWPAPPGQSGRNGPGAYNNGPCATPPTPAGAYNNGPCATPPAPAGHHRHPHTCQDSPSAAHVAADRAFMPPPMLGLTPPALTAHLRPLPTYQDSQSAAHMLGDNRSLMAPPFMGPAGAYHNGPCATPPTPAGHHRQLHPYQDSPLAAKLAVDRPTMANPLMGPGDSDRHGGWSQSGGYPTLPPPPPQNGLIGLFR